MSYNDALSVHPIDLKLKEHTALMQLKTMQKLFLTNFATIEVTA